MGPYNWKPIFEYIKENGHDGAIYRESDDSISYYFDGYLAMNPNQIQILYVSEIK